MTLKFKVYSFWFLVKDKEKDARRSERVKKRVARNDRKKSDLQW